jgi:hypothetical protein
MTTKTKVCVLFLIRLCDYSDDDCELMHPHHVKFEDICFDCYNNFKCLNPRPPCLDCKTDKEIELLDAWRFQEGVLKLNAERMQIHLDTTTTDKVGAASDV